MAFDKTYLCNLYLTKSAPISSSRRLGHVVILSPPSDLLSMAEIKHTAHRSRLRLDLLESQTATLSSLYDSSQQRYLTSFPRCCSCPPHLISIRGEATSNRWIQLWLSKMAASRTVKQKRQHSLSLGLSCSSGL